MFILKLEVRVTGFIIKKGNRFLGGASRIKDEVSLNPNDEFEWIQTVKLDEVLVNECEWIGLIHLDVERHEISALNGSRDVIDKHRPIIILELWKTKTDEICEYMFKIGYQFMVKVKNLELERAIDWNVVIFSQPLRFYD